MNIVKEAFAEGIQKLQGARLDAAVLLAHVLGLNDSNQLMLHYDQTLSPQQQQKFRELIEKRLLGAPIAHLTGYKEFWSLQFLVTTDTLIPRPETELLVEQALWHLPDKQKHYNILDLGTGTGCLIIALLKEYPNSQGLAVDISTKALGVAKKNALQNQVLDRLQLLHSSWLEQVPIQQFDLVVSNPPYIPLEQLTQLNTSVRDFEPISSLTDFSDGMQHYRQISEQLLPYLHHHSIVLMEFGQHQEHEVKDIFAKRYTILGLFKDLNQIIRAIAVTTQKI